ncbi:MAG TPA: LytTR family DNA-binding domain-containing protein [Parafilimonas sp.]|nr:LytTR family DNA-binding domain-containing protein [Parafilimonas sp.]
MDSLNCAEENSEPQIILKAIIIDDEARSRKALQIALNDYCPSIQIAVIAETAESGIEAIIKHKPDIVFLDVQMPGMSGFDLLAHFPEINFDVVFITAHDHYAIKAIRFSALDYLLKPIQIDELMAAVKKAEEKKNYRHINWQYKSLYENVRSGHNASGSVAVPTGDGLLLIKTQQIIRCEAEGNYVLIFQEGREKMLITKTLGDIESMLNPKEFFRVHNSHIVNLSHIKKYVKGDGGYVIMSDNSTVDVSRRKKEEFLQMLSSR